MIVAALLPDVKRIAISGGYHGTHQVIDILRALRPSLDIIPLPPSVSQGADVLQVRWHIIGNARIEAVAKSWSCMVSRQAI